MIINYLHFIFASWLMITGQEPVQQNYKFSLTQSETPSARSGYAFAYDANRDIVVLFGGQDNASKKLGDTWAWFNGI